MYSALSSKSISTQENNTSIMYACVIHMTIYRKQDGANNSVRERDWLEGSKGSDLLFANVVLSVVEHWVGLHLGLHETWYWNIA